tara:strand:- start:2818 stop:3234 length:417 start_codon:yes stop_codon:yes gene_type:complete
LFIDASAIIAILDREPGSDEIVKRLAAAKTTYYSPLVHYEAVLGLARAHLRPKGVSKADHIASARAAVDAFLAEVRCKCIMISDGIGRGAVDAAQTYGKAVGHEADLNFGDCFSYACAKSHRLPLVYVGNDFLQTDLA